VRRTYKYTVHTTLKLGFMRVLWSVLYSPVGPADLGAAGGPMCGIKLDYLGEVAVWKVWVRMDVGIDEEMSEEGSEFWWLLGFLGWSVWVRLSVGPSKMNELDAFWV